MNDLHSGTMVCAALFAAACVGLSSTARAAELPVMFEYTGGATSLWDVMDEAGDGAGGTGVFADAGFQSNLVNVFVADLRNSGNLGGAGVTVFAMWGNGTDPHGEFEAQVELTPPDGIDLLVGEGCGEVFAQGSEIFALGDGVQVNPKGVSVFGEVFPGDATPRGFAITNLQDMPLGELGLLLNMEGSIAMAGLFSFGDDQPWMPPADWSAFLPIATPIGVPIPSPVFLAIPGIVGLVVFRRRLVA